METSSLINKTSSSSCSCSDLNNNVPNSHSPTATILSHNGFVSPHLDVSDIEMIAIQTVTYTSLRDLLPSSPPTIASPTHNSSLHDEIPIKNPLVKHAALAYLQPKSTPPEAGGKGLFRRIKDNCGCTDGVVECLDWLREVVWKPVREALFGDGGRRDVGWDEDDDDEEDEDYEAYVKVDRS